MKKRQSPRIVKLRKIAESCNSSEQKLQCLKDIHTLKYTARSVPIESLAYIFNCKEQYIIDALKTLSLYNTKKCKSCEKWLDFDNFYYSDSYNTRVYDPHCIPCKNAINNKWHNDNKEYHNKLNSKNGKSLEYKKYYSDYYFENKLKIRKKANINQNIRYATDPGFKLKKRLLNGIYNYFKRGVNDGIVKLLPYTMDELKTHLESQFDNSMNWANYGSYWSLDHIRPISSFDIIDEKSEDFLKCWGLFNLRPLENTRNFEKRDKYVAGT